ncbi:MAG: EAL domain-containing protein [Gammaproteobacteria bacterium]|nr:EAL domain-containing protein [Gammaproteobacteria bacterium]
MNHLFTSEIIDIALQHTQDAIMVTDCNNKITYINQAFKNVTGYQTEEVIGKLPSILKSGKHENTFYKDLWSTLISNGHWEGEIWDKRKSGEIYLEYLSITTRNNEQGKITHYIAVFTDINERYEKNRQIQQITDNDTLTELANRERVSRFLKTQLATSRKKHELIAVISLDLDNFKTVNDHHGHAIGDRLLVILAKRLKSLIRNSDLVGRIGGDEFAIILPELKSIDEAEKMASRILSLVSSTIELDRQKYQITTSLGITVFPFDDSDAEMLLRHADQAMYKAKEEGKNQSHIFDTNKDHEIQTRNELVHQLENAIKLDELVLFYQPKVNMRTGAVIGAEALIRWQHPDEGLLAPGSFLPHIEYHDLIVDIGNWVLRKALTQLDSWLKQGLDISVSINIAAKQILKRNFFDSLSMLLKEFPDVPTHQIELEILESSALDNIEHVIKVIKQCQKIGIKFSLDDFGTGYASLSYLRDIPVDTLKIDQSFVLNLLENKKDLTLIEAVVGLANAFQRDIIAEGVETTEQGVLLMRLGCDQGQGYGIAKPMPAKDFPAWVKQFKPKKEWSIWADTSWEMGDFPLLVAQYDHIDWVKRILIMLESNFDNTIKNLTVSNHYECRFGHWYYGHGKQHYGQSQAFIDLEPIHLQVHKVGQEIIQLANKGNIDLARKKTTILLDLKDQVLLQLTKLQIDVARKLTNL